MPRFPSLLLTLCLGTLPAQNRSTLPAACQVLPGNAALSLPLRWSHGTLQVRVDSPLLPAGFVGRTIHGLRLRRPTFLGEPAYPALQRTLTVRGGFQPQQAVNFTQDLALNRPANPQVLFGPAPVAVPATAAPGAGTSIGEEFLVLPFSPPLPVVAGTLFLEFEAGDAPLQVGADHWVDAVWFDGGVETGYAVTVGAGSCTTRAEPTELVWTGAAGPRVGGTADLRLLGVAPGSFVYAWTGLSPESRAASATWFGWGGSLGPLSPGLAACHQWAPLDASWGGLADAFGRFDTSFPLAASYATAGLHLGVQAAWIDLARPGLPLSVANGVALVLNQIGVGNRCGCVYFPGAATWSPWLPFHGQMPVIVLEHD
ncbi:MAG: hypothetical protein FJ265_09830 [Planctomycetes bacterium]|nr:hypothetical protein [Planctomycetota bacterium]